MEDMLIEQKILDMMLYGHQALKQFPKSERFTLAAKIEECMLTILRRVTEAKKKYYKKTTLQELDVEISVLKVYLRLSYKLGFLPPKKYEIWSSQVVEIGKMVGGWIKTQSQASSSKK